jgi:RNA polymerase sigma factor (sigma-70 family)
MLFTCRQDRNKFLAICYKDGIRVAKRRYFPAAGIEATWNYHDIVSQAILQISRQLETREFESELHAKCWFMLGLRAQASKLRKHYKADLSLDQQVKEDSNTTFEEFIASRIIYPSLEDEELKGQIDDALKILSKEENNIIYQIWVQGIETKQVAIALRKPEKYIKRVIDTCKLKLARKLLACKN